MKVGFAGAQCSGKTTQATMLSERDGFIAVPSASRLAANMGVPVNRDGNLSTQFVIIGKIEAQRYLYEQRETACFGKPFNIVWERTHVDALAYSQTCDLWDVKNHYLICHRALAEDQIKNYFDIVFYFPAYDLNTFRGEIVDGVRDIDPYYRSRVGNIIKNELDSIDASYYTVPNGTPDEIYDFIWDKLIPTQVTTSLEKHDTILKRLSAS